MTKAALRADPGAGHPFLVFLNTVTDDGKSRDQNSFDNAAGMQAALQAGGIPVKAAINGHQMRALLRLRDTAYAAFSAIAAGRAPEPQDALHLTNLMRATLAEADLRITRTGLITAPGPLLRPLDQVVLSMEDLLRSDQFTRLSECRRCTHLFLNQGRGVGRRWCSMSRCGNRAKAENFRARQRDAA